MKKRHLKWLILPGLAIIAFVGFNSFTEASESSANTCTNHCESNPSYNCIVTVNGKTTTCYSMHSKP